ncbi:MAG: hypothetical protein B655_1661 [Methanobacterium sp. Maddingley MBC34]|nr:MAG: hypothetical protein B655_1661 [Methanobacterium sp. Maddingley MBC34]
MNIPSMGWFESYLFGENKNLKIMKILNFIDGKLHFEKIDEKLL